MTCSETPIQMTAEFSFEIIEARRKWYNIFQPPKKKKKSLSAHNSIFGKNIL